MIILKILVGSILFILVFYALSRIFWKAGTDQIDSVLNDKLESYLPKTIKKDDNKEN